ncbi:phage antirepressor [Pseudolactococcus insecticola]|uniref:Phage antirepressor KilAC domain-containing protein n=1 Tax=Pseudolactococcus insecticola TaxID=2709158 RepID=A0A6A0B5F5_9LACT|nr:phage antirepressor [Lactococcus insecticola]GFH40256.1 phage antirepressor KilAC domain-containing protein [Lactococcus insecticola]
MNKELQIFNNLEFGEIRTTVVNEEPMFVGKDVASILGYSNTRKALADHVDAEDKDGVTIRDAIGREQTVISINESGLYSLILSSKMPNAKKFKRWVTSEVLPAIRKHGVYAVEELINNPDLAIAALTALKDERDKNSLLNQKLAIQNQQISELKPKATYYDVILQCKDLVAISVIAKDYGWTANKMNQFLHSKGIQFKQGRIWLLYKKFAEQGYTSTKTHSYDGKDGTMHSNIHTYWTQKGRLFIYDLLKIDGILPMIERGNEND